MTDFELMGAALDEARKAAALGEVPVGAVVAKDGEIVAAAHNTRETEKNALHHAELLAIDAACKKLGGWRLWQCELFVTLEPLSLIHIFPGHVALYLGEGRYIHSTGAAVSGGVVINSLEPEDPLYRDDLVKSLYAVGSVF